MKHNTLPPNGESPARNGIADTFNSFGRAIRTKYFGPTNCKGSRVRAWIADDGKPLAAVTVSWDYSLRGPFENHVAAALAVLEKSRKVSDGHFAPEPVALAGSYLGNGEYAFAINARA